MAKRRFCLFTGIFFLLCAAFRGVPQAPTPYEFPVLNGFPPMPANPANPTTKEGVALGRMLFYDPILSRNEALSCGSCHRQEAAFSDAPHRFSADRFGRPLARNTLPLFNLAWQPAFFWDGRAGTLEEQVFQPVTAHREMNLSWKEVTLRLKRKKPYPELFKAAFGKAEIDSEQVAKAIAQFERTILSYRSKYDRVLDRKERFTRAEAAGFEIVSDMSMGGCFPCHDFDGSALGVMPGFSNNGLDAPQGLTDMGRLNVTGKGQDKGAFRIPSLRNIALTAPYMHDGRFRTLEEVLNFYRNGLHTGQSVDARIGAAASATQKLTDADLKNILAFLHTLTDSALLSDPAYSNPW